MTYFIFADFASISNINRTKTSLSLYLLLIVSTYITLNKYGFWLDLYNLCTIIWSYKLFTLYVIIICMFKSVVNIQLPAKPAIWIQSSITCTHTHALAHTQINLPLVTCRIQFEFRYFYMDKFEYLLCILCTRKWNTEWNLFRLHFLSLWLCGMHGVWAEFKIKVKLVVLIVAPWLTTTTFEK